MTNSRHIIDELIMDPKSLEVIDKLDPKELREDLKHHIYLTLIDFDQNKIIKAYKEKYLNKLVGRIILSQIKSDTSDFYMMYRNGGFRKGINFIEFPDLTLNEDEYKEKENRRIWVKKKVKEINRLLRSNHPYHSTLFRMYFYEDLTYQQIAKRTGINFQSVRTSVLKTISFLQNNMNYE